MKLYSFKDGFKNARKKAGYTQKSFADTFTLTDGTKLCLKTIQNWEQGISIPDFGTMIDLCHFFDDCDMDYLLGNINTKTHNSQFIQDITGLSENAIECLSQWNSEAQDKSDSIHAAGYDREFLDSQIGYASSEYLDIINLLFEIRHETDRNGNCLDSPNSHIFYLIHSYLNHNIKRISNVTKDDYESLEISEDGIQVSENSDGVSDEFNLSEIHKRITLDKIRDELEEIAKWKSANDK